MDHKPFGVEFVPKEKRAKIVDGMVCAGKISEILPGKAKAIALEHFRIAVFNIDGEFFAIKDACPHAEYPLSKGIVRGEEVTCASHGWQFNLRTGECLRGEVDSVRKFEVVVKGDEVFVYGDACLFQNRTRIAAGDPFFS